MCDIPVDLERRFERRWAARFSAGPAKEHRLKGSGNINGSPRPTRANENPAGLPERQPKNRSRSHQNTAQTLTRSIAERATPAETLLQHPRSSNVPNVGLQV
jgi:hypothetical protein